MDKMNKTDKINKNKVEKILEEMVKNEENNEESNEKNNEKNGTISEIEEFLSKKTMDDVYKFFLKKDPSITIDEFDNCVAEMLELSINTPKMEPIDNDNIDKIVGGANIVKQFSSKMTSMLLAALTLLPGISSMASASAVDTHTAAGEGNKSSIAEKCCQMKDTVESLSKSGFNNISNFVKKHPWITTGICAAMLAATGTAIAMKNRNSRADKSNQENKSEVKQSGNTSATQSNDSKKSEVKENNDDSAHSGAPGLNKGLLAQIQAGKELNPTSSENSDSKKSEVKENNDDSAHSGAPGLNKGLLAQIQAGKKLKSTSPNTDSEKHEVQAKDNNDNEDRARAVAELDKKLKKKQEEYGKNNTPSRDPLMAMIQNNSKIKHLQELNKHDEEDDEHSNNPEELNNDNSASQDTDSKQADGDMSQVSNTPAPPPPPPFPNIKPSTDSKKPEVKAKANNDNSAPSGAPASGQNQDLLAQIKAGIKLKPTSVKKKQEEYGKNNTPSGDSLIAAIAENPTIDTMLGKVKPVEVDNNQTTDDDWETSSEPAGKIDKKTLTDGTSIKTDDKKSWTNEGEYGTDAPAEANNPAKPKSGPSNTTPRPLPTPQSKGKSAKPPAAAAQTLAAAKPTVKPNSNQSGTNKRTLPTPKPQGTAAQTLTAAQTSKTAAKPPAAAKTSTTAKTSTVVKTPTAAAKTSTAAAKTSTAAAKPPAAAQTPKVAQGSAAQTPTAAQTSKTAAQTSTVESQSKTKEEQISDLENQIKQLEEERKPYKIRLGHFRTKEEKSKEKEFNKKINDLQDQIKILKSNR